LPSYLKPEEEKIETQKQKYCILPGKASKKRRVKFDTKHPWPLENIDFSLVKKLHNTLKSHIS